MPTYDNEGDNDEPTSPEESSMTPIDDGYRYYPYGMLDFVDKVRGITVRFLNPRNIIIYIEI